MTIIHLLVGLGGGGAEHFVLELARQNKSNNNRVIVIGITSIRIIERKFIDNGIEYVILDINGISSMYRGFEKLLFILKENKNCILHAHMFHACMLAVLAKSVIPSLKIVFTLHTNFVKQAYRKGLIYMTRFFREADVIFSNDAKRWYNKSNSVVIQNGIDTSRFNLLSNRPSKFTFLFLGRLQEPKNPLYLIEFVNKLKGKYNFVINIAGDGDLMHKLKQRIKDEKIEEMFNFLGFRNDIPELLFSSHCMIMPSLWEGMPISILEAGAAGLPVIATPVGSIPAVLNNSNGYLSELEDFHEIAAQVMNDYPLAKSKASNLRSLIVAEYDIEISAQKHHHLYDKVYR